MADLGRAAGGGVRGGVAGDGGGGLRRKSSLVGGGDRNAVERKYLIWGGRPTQRAGGRGRESPAFDEPEPIALDAAGWRASRRDNHRIVRWQKA
jgi:hypothetical protein